MWLEFPDSKDRLGHLGLRANLGFQDDRVVQASMDSKGRRETHLVSRERPDHQDHQADLGSSTAPKEPCSPSLPDPTAKCP